MTLSTGLVTITLWIGMAGFGALISFFNLAIAREDLVYQIGKTERRQQRALIAKVNIANELMRLVALILLFIAGIMVAWRTEFNPSPAGTSLYVRSVILLTILILVANTLTHRWLRHTLASMNKVKRSTNGHT